MEEIFQLKAEVSSLTFQLASLREDNSRLQRTLLDQETSFSYALKNCQAERMDREQRIGKQEEQVRLNTDTVLHVLVEKADHTIHTLNFKMFFPTS